MTYNFDPDRWLENHQVLLEKRLLAGDISRTEYHEAVKVLDERYHQMCARLDGSYRIPEPD